MKTVACRTTTEAFEDALASAHRQEYTLQLFVSARSQSSHSSVTTTQKFCEKFLNSRYRLEVFDLDQSPEAAQNSQITVTPMLVRVMPLPMKRFAGTHMLRKFHADFLGPRGRDIRLHEAEETLNAITSGRVDALVINGDASDNIMFLRTASEEAAERLRHNAQMEFQANHDALTGLANRHRLHDRLQEALISAARYGHMISIAFIDLDHFKYINDSLGHNVGDQLLQVISLRLKSCLREVDTVARLGGDEFVLVIDHSDDLTISLVIAKILASVAQPISIGERELLVTCSIGLSLYPVDGSDAGTLLRHADAALYRAKEKGRNNFQMYTPELNLKINRRMAMETNLRQALERNEFFLEYQPKISLSSGAVIGVEALIRWVHEESVILPVNFISLAEEIGLIVPIGEWVLRTACAQNSAWQKMSLPKIVMSVNLSSRQLKERELVSVVRQVLLDTGLDAKYLELELTESMLIEHAESNILTLSQLKDVGVTISIDDFGTGYSSLSYLKRLPIDALKIDKSFVDNIPEGPDDTAIVALIISLAHILRLRVIAEGVETAAQLDYLHDQGCDDVQGYFFSQAVTHQEIERMLREPGSLWQ